MNFFTEILKNICSLKRQPIRMVYLISLLISFCLIRQMLLMMVIKNYERNYLQEQFGQIFEKMIALTVIR